MSNNYESIVAKMQAAVIEKATTDAAFKAELKANPRATVEKVFNVTLPAEVKIEVQQAPANTVVLSLPYQIEGGKDGELSDSDLESVAGGSKSGATAFFKGFGSGLGLAAGGAAIIATEGSAAGVLAQPMGTMVDKCF